MEFTDIQDHTNTSQSEFQTQTSSDNSQSSQEEMDEDQFNSSSDGIPPAPPLLPISNVRIPSKQRRGVPVHTEVKFLSPSFPHKYPELNTAEKREANLANEKLLQTTKSGRHQNLPHKRVLSIKEDAADTIQRSLYRMSGSYLKQQVLEKDHATPANYRDFFIGLGFMALGALTVYGAVRLFSWAISASKQVNTEISANVSVQQPLPASKEFLSGAQFAPK